LSLSTWQTKTTTALLGVTAFKGMESAELDRLEAHDIALPAAGRLFVEGVSHFTVSRAFHG
jgi:hypothetical protein